jgi:hypothetical protein
MASGSFRQTVININLYILSLSLSVAPRRGRNAYPRGKRYKTTARCTFPFIFSFFSDLMRAHVLYNMYDGIDAERAQPVSWALFITPPGHLILCLCSQRSGRSMNYAVLGNTICPLREFMTFAFALTARTTASTFRHPTDSDGHSCALLLCCLSKIEVCKFNSIHHIAL